MTINDIMALDIDTFNSWSESDLRKLTSRLASAANKRLKRLKDKGLSTPASRYVYQSGGKFSTKGKKINALRSEFIRTKNFLQAKTSTIKGYNKIQKETSKTLKDLGINISSDKVSKLFEIYDKLKEENPDITENQLKYGTLKDLSAQMTDWDETDDDDYEKILNIMEGKSDLIYEEIQKGKADDISEFFEQ